MPNLSTKLSETIETKTPGKLFLAGEFSMIETGHYGIGVPVDKFISIQVKQASQTKITSFEGESQLFYRKTYKDQVSYQDQDRDKKWRFVAAALSMIESYLITEDLKNYDITITSQMETLGKKIGLGSSAAVVVGLIESILLFYDYQINKNLVFKLASLASLSLSPQASYADLATIAYKQPILYRKPDVLWLKEQMTRVSIYDLVHMTWKDLEIKPLNFPSQWQFMVGWTGSPASSSDLVAKVKEKSKDDSWMSDFRKKSDKYTLKLAQALTLEDANQAFCAIDKLRQNHQALQTRYGVEIETKSLATLSDIAKSLGYASRFSGAGGGDCGFAIRGTIIDPEALVEAWAKEGIEYLPIRIYEE